MGEWGWVGGHRVWSRWGWGGLGGVEGLVEVSWGALVVG